MNRRGFLKSAAGFMAALGIGATIKLPEFEMPKQTPKSEQVIEYDYLRQGWNLKVYTSEAISAGKVVMLNDNAVVGVALSDVVDGYVPVAISGICLVREAKEQR